MEPNTSTSEEIIELVTPAAPRTRSRRIRQTDIGTVRIPVETMAQAIEAGRR